MKPIHVLFAAGILLASPASAQKIEWETGGDLAFLKGQKVLSVEYDYSNITVKKESEQAYLKSQQEELNKETPGDGDAFVDEWTKARTAKYQPHFETQFNKRFAKEKDSIVVRQNDAAKYTVLVTTYDMDLGKGKMFVKKPALVTFTISIVETANKSKVVAKGKLEEVKGEVNAPKGSGWMPGGGIIATVATVQNRDYSNRIAEAYEKAGDILAKAIIKAL